MNYLKNILIVCIAIITPLCIQAQQFQNWHWKDLQKDSVHGVSLEKGYQYLASLPLTAQPIVVAIIDGGIDTNHTALQSYLWHNPKEITGNGIDDDHNGYIDDMHGWNFLGNANGKNINKASDEKSRLFHQYKNVFKQVDSASLSGSQLDIFEQWKQASKEMTFNEEEAANLQYITMSKNVLKRVGNILSKEIEDSNFTLSTLIAYEPIGRVALEGKITYIRTFNILSLDSSLGHAEIMDELEEYIDGKEKSMHAIENTPEDTRAQIIHDQEDNIHDKAYGNNDIMGPSPKHGTHVAGLASHENKLIQIMGIRAVPDGDEYDKDIALAIFYAVINGAKVINMSFGKSYSPHHHWVDSAMRYAASKDVLLVHSAGNEKYDLNIKNVYPNPYSHFYNDTASTLITIGASSDSIIKKSLITDFSNFGNKVVDVLSPGEKIYSTLPSNQFGYLNGTSMASPIVTHIAAMIRAYFPKLSAKDIKSILMQSAWTPKDALTLEAMQPSAKTAGVVNAYNAFVMAKQWNDKLVRNNNKKKSNK